MTTLAAGRGVTGNLKMPSEIANDQTPEVPLHDQKMSRTAKSSSRSLHALATDTPPSQGSTGGRPASPDCPKRIAPVILGPMNHPVSIIGLGVMGRRMLKNMTRYAGFKPVALWDPDADALAKAHALYPEVPISGSADAAILESGCSTTYIACPPLFHHEYAHKAFDNGQAVFCEKPLGVDIEISRQLTERAKVSGLVNIVNYSLASAPAATELERQYRAERLGDVVGVDLRVHFSQWPEDWQIDAASWLDFPQQGGFVREVVSHWIYLTERLFGPSSLHDAWIRYPTTKTSETHMHAALQAGGTPITVAGSGGGRGPDQFEYTVWGTRASARISDWGQLTTSQGKDWHNALPALSDPREVGYERQIDNAANAVAGLTHSMPCFEDALSVQVLIEAMVNA